MIKAYNDWHVDEWCGAYPERFIPCGILPLFDVDEAAAEVRRLAAKGCHAVTFSENPAGLGMPSIHSGAWDPLFARVLRRGHRAVLPRRIVVEVGVDRRPTPRAPVPMSLSSVMAIYTLGDLLWADFWHRFPELRFALTEGDIGWIPYFLQRAEHTLRPAQRVDAPRGAAGLVGPTELFRERILCCFIEDAVGVQLLDRLQRRQRVLGVRLPALRQLVARRAGASRGAVRGPRSPTIVDKITHGNAMHHFQFDPFAIRTARTVHGRPRSGPRPPTSTPSPTRAGPPTLAISSRGASSRLVRGDAVPGNLSPL